MKSHVFTWLGVMITTSLTISGCSIFFPDKPTVVINSPLNSTQYPDGAVVTVQSTASDSKGIARVELAADGSVVHIATPPNLESTFTVVQTWTAIDGAHTLTVRAFNTSGTPSNPSSIAVLVGGTITTTPVAAPAITQAPAPTPLAPPALPPTAVPPTAVPPTGRPSCVDNSAFVQDVTVPSGTTLSPGQPFEKVWRVRNTGSCTWNSGYKITFAGGAGMTQTIGAPVPDTPPGSTADLLVSMTAPTMPGNQNSLWQMQAPGGELFGAMLGVSIVVAVPATATTPRCSGTPAIASFSASPTTITAGQSANLSWGFVGNADTAEIDQGIGGVATPGRTTVKPASTTTYTMTARCGNNTRTAQVTISVVAPAPTTAPPPSQASPTPTVTATRTTTAGATITRCSIQGESGEAIKAGRSFSASQALNVGDDGQNRTYHTFLSFDVSDLAGKTIDLGNLTIGSPSVRGNPVSLGPFFVESVEYSPPVVGSSFDRSGTQLLIIPGAPGGQYDIRAAIQNAVRANRSRFQLRFRLAADNNGNSSPDMYTWGSNNEVCLSIGFH